MVPKKHCGLVPRFQEIINKYPDDLYGIDALFRNQPLSHYSENQILQETTECHEI